MVHEQVYTDTTRYADLMWQKTKLRFAALCSKKFNWETAEIEEGSDDDDVEIA